MRRCIDTKKKNSACDVSTVSIVLKTFNDKIWLNDRDMLCQEKQIGDDVSIILELTCYC